VGLAVVRSIRSPRQLGSQQEIEDFDLDMRRQRWPDTANAHPFLTKQTGRRTEECSKRWIWLTIGPDRSVAAVREDRILDEAHATGGDVRRLADLFGLSIEAGTRYTNTVGHPDLTREE
jgi:hypothetical protein